MTPSWGSQITHAPTTLQKQHTCANWPAKAQALYAAAYWAWTTSSSCRLPATRFSSPWPSWCGKKCTSRTWPPTMECFRHLSVTRNVMFCSFLRSASIFSGSFLSGNFASAPFCFSVVTLMAATQVSFRVNVLSLFPLSSAATLDRALVEDGARAIHQRR